MTLEAIIAANRTNLNTVALPKSKSGGFDFTVQDRSTGSGRTVAHFGNVAGALEQFLLESESVVGCVAWLSSPRLIAALAGTPVSFIVNKEFALRSTDNKTQSKRKRAVLEQLTGGLHTKQFPAPLTALDMPLEAVRCFGQAGGAYSPFMHSKFVVRLRKGKPVAVWTGSLNMTTGSEQNIENAVEIHDATIARAYFEEYARVASLSEPLEFRTGAPSPGTSGRPVKPAPTTTRVVKGKRVSAKRAGVKTVAPAKRGRKPAASGMPRTKAA